MHLLSRLAPLSLGVVLFGLAGCHSADQLTPAARLAAPWTRPAFATRDIPGDPATVRAACAAALASMGFEGARREGGLGRLSAQRRQASADDGARQLTFDATLTLLGPGIVRLETDFRELIEYSDNQPPAGGLIRSRPLYDAFFERLLAELDSSTP